MADDNSQDDSGNAQTRKSSFQKAADQARDELDSPDEGGSSENNESTESEDASSAQDVKDREETAESDESQDVSEETEADESASSDSEQATEPEIEGDDEGPVPYERFKEVVDERNELRDDKSELETENNQLQSELHSLLNTEEGQQQLVEYLEEEGAIDQSSPEDGEGGESSESLDEALGTLEQFLTDDQVEAIREVARAEAGNAGQQEEDDPGSGNVQERKRRIRNKLEAMKAKESEFQEIEEVAEKPFEEGAGERTWMDVVIEENPDRFTDQTGMPTPDDLELVYYKALERADLNGGSPSDNGSESEPKTEEEIREEVREEVESELQEAQSKEPVSPSGGSPDVQETEGNMSLSESLREAADEEGFSL